MDAHPSDSLSVVSLKPTHFTNMNDIIRKWEVVPVNCVCHVFTLETNPECHLVTAHLREMKVVETEVVSETLQIKYIHLGTWNV